VVEVTVAKDVGEQEDLAAELRGIEGELRMVTLNIDTLTKGKLKDVLALIRFRRLDIMVLQDTRIAKPRTQFINRATSCAHMQAP
jgi:hypothetical protein